MPCGRGGLVFVWRLGRLRRGQGAKGGAAPPLRPPTPPITPRFPRAAPPCSARLGRAACATAPLMPGATTAGPTANIRYVVPCLAAFVSSRSSSRLPSFFALCWLGVRVTMFGAAGVCRCATTPLYAALNVLRKALGMWRQVCSTQHPEKGSGMWRQVRMFRAVFSLSPQKIFLLRRPVQEGCLWGRDSTEARF